MENEKTPLNSTLGTVALALCFIAIIGVPLIFAPFLTDPLEMPKQLLVFFLGIFGMLVWTIRNLFQKKFIWVKSAFDLPLILLAVTAVISSLLAPNFYSSLSAETLLVVGGVCLYLLFSAVPQKENLIEKFTLFFSLSGAILGGFLILELLSSTLNFTFFFSGLNIAGSALASCLFLVCILPMAIAHLKSSNLKQKALSTIIIIFISVGIAASGFALYQNKPILLDHLSGWKIATGVIGQSPKNALLGAGPGNTVDAFTQFKPASFNQSQFWNLKFSTSSNLYLTILTSLGIAGLALVAFFVVKFIQIANARLKLTSTPAVEKGLITTIALTLVLGLIFPTPLLSLFLLFTASGTLMSHYRLKGVSLYSKTQESDKKFVGVAMTIFLGAILIGSAYFLGRFALADFFFARSLEAAAQNKGKDTYDLQIKALELNPWNSNFRSSYSQTNLALANSLAGQANLTDEQKQTVVTLVQQAIREARNAVALAPQRSSAWENLSVIYRNLINFAQGADQWAVASENQAIVFDPTNPRLRLDLGSIYFAAKDYQTAAQFFSAAVNLKSDLANAHYNLAQALKSLGQNQLALQELQTTSTLICASANGQADCVKVNTEIDELNKQMSKEETKSNETTPPAKSQSNSEQEPLSTPSGKKSANLQKAVSTTTPQVGSSSGELKL